METVIEKKAEETQEWTAAQILEICEETRRNPVKVLDFRQGDLANS